MVIHDGADVFRFEQASVRKAGRDDVFTELFAELAFDRIQKRFELVRQRGILPEGNGRPYRIVPLRRRHGGDVNGVFSRNFRSGGGLAQERRKDGVLAQRGAADGAAEPDEILCEHLRVEIRNAVHARESRKVADAGLLKKHHGRRTDFPRLAGVRLPVDPCALGGGGGKLAPDLRAFAAGVAALHYERREVDNRLVEKAHVGGLVRGQFEIDALVGDRLVLQDAPALGSEVCAGLGEYGLALELRVFDELLVVLGRPEKYVAGNEVLKEGDIVALVQSARGGKTGVGRIARGGERRLARLRVVRVQFAVGTDRPCAGVGVDRCCIAVEYGANLRTGKGLDAALGELPVGSACGIGAESEVAADARQLLRADAVLGKRPDEGVLDRQHLKVGKGRLVRPREMDPVVYLFERGLAGEPHLAGVVLAVGNGLKLLDRDVYVREVDLGRHC